MLNQAAVEALYSATYIENYLDCVENLPDDLQRHISRVRELDVTYQGLLKEVEQQQESFHKETESIGRKRSFLVRVQQALISAQEVGDEKLQIIQQLQDLIENKARQLDIDYRNLADVGKDQESQDLNKDNNNIHRDSVSLSSNNNGITGGERQSKRARRTRNDVGPGTDLSMGLDVSPLPEPANGNEAVGQSKTSVICALKVVKGKQFLIFVKTLLRNVNELFLKSKKIEKQVQTTIRKKNSGSFILKEVQSSQQQSASAISNSSSNQKKTGNAAAGKKKKRKNRQNLQQQQQQQQSLQQQRDDSPQQDDELPIDPDEPTYCLCDQISYGEMIMCDNDLCPYEWFHFSCVSLGVKPKGKWYCPKCRGDRSSVMKPKAQFMKELERYNKEKEQKEGTGS